MEDETVPVLRWFGQSYNVIWERIVAEIESELPQKRIEHGSKVKLKDDIESTDLFTQFITFLSMFDPSLHHDTYLEDPSYGTYEPEPEPQEPTYPSPADYIDYTDEADYTDYQDYIIDWEPEEYE